MPLQTGSYAGFAARILRPYLASEDRPGSSCFGAKPWHRYELLLNATSSYQSKWETPRPDTSENLVYGEECVTGEPRRKGRSLPAFSLNVRLEQPWRRFPISEDMEMVLAFVKDIRYCTEPSLGSP